MVSDCFRTILITRGTWKVRWNGLISPLQAICHIEQADAFRFLGPLPPEILLEASRQRIREIDRRTNVALYRD